MVGNDDLKGNSRVIMRGRSATWQLIHPGLTKGYPHLKPNAHLPRPQVRDIRVI